MTKGFLERANDLYMDVTKEIEKAVKGNDMEYTNSLIRVIDYLYCSVHELDNSIKRKVK